MSRRFTRTFQALVLLASVLLLSSIAAWAQAEAATGQIVGTVTDPTGATIASATVKVTGKTNGVERAVQTSAEGFYRVVLLPPSTYQVEVSAPGFSNATTAQVVVQVGRTSDLNVALGISARQETVEVTAEGVQVTQSTSGSLLNETAIDNLPINGRRFHDFITLTPTAQVEPSRNQISLSGQRGINGNINIDGLDYNQPFFGGIRGGERSNNAYTIPQESIREFQVVAAGYSAEFGRSTGGIVTAVTKDGTNDLHGSGFYLNRDKSLATSNAYFKTLGASPSVQGRELTLAPTQHQWGGSIGGPIKKNKLFYFGSYEQQKQNINREVLLSNLIGVTPTAATAEALAFMHTQEGPFEQTNNAKTFLGRVDWQINDSQRMNVRYSYSDNNAANAVINGASLNPVFTSALSNNGIEKDNTNNVVGQWTKLFGATMSNELRSQWTREERPRVPNALQPTVTTSIARFGTVNFLPTTEMDWRYQLADNISKVVGNHTFKVGGEYNFLHAEQVFAFNQFGNYNVRPGTTQVASILSIMTACTDPATCPTIHNRFDDPFTNMNYQRAIGNGQLAFHYQQVAFFGQDSWKVKPNLTLNYGLRWEGIVNPQPEATNTSLINRVKSSVFPCQSLGLCSKSIDPTQIPNQLKEFGPRVGFAWDPFKTGKTVIRGYGGIYYAATPSLLYSTPLNNFRATPGDVSVTLPFTVPAGNPNSTLYRQFLLAGVNLNNFTLGNLPVLSVAQLNTIATALGFSDPFAGAQLTLVDTNYRDPRSTQAGFSVEHEVMRGVNLGADFSYINTSFLQRNTDVNTPVPTKDAFGRNIYPTANNALVRPVSNLGSVQLRDSSARALYRAVDFRANIHRKYGQLNLAYTLSENLSSDDNERDAGGVSYADLFDLSREYSFSKIDAKHQFVANPVVYLWGGFEVSGAVRARTGRPFDATVGSDVNKDGVNNDRPLIALGVPMQRNAFRNRSVTTVDTRVQKTFKLGESKQIKAFADIFNIFNETNIELSSTGGGFTFCSTAASNCGLAGVTNLNFDSLIDNRTGATKGTLITGNNPGPPRQFQLGVRFEF